MVIVCDYESFFILLSQINSKEMNISEQTLQQIDRAIRKVSEKFPATEEAELMTDIHIRVAQETGELTVFNDNDEEITRLKGRIPSPRRPTKRRSRLRRSGP